MKKVVLYGAGKLCKELMPMINEKFAISAIIDRNQQLWGKCLYEIPIISLTQYLEEYRACKIILTVNDDHAETAIEALTKAGITDYSPYYDIIDFNQPDPREVVISYSMPDQLEDVIFYHVFRDFEDIFYIDVGSNDPVFDSVTKLLYDTKNAHGINIEPLRELIDMTDRQRTRDKNICIGLSDADGMVDFFVQGGLSTALEQNISGKRHIHKSKRTIPITTLEKICDRYVPDGQQISFLKIDVEGYERNVLLGANFKKYRPMVIVMEATLPNTMIPCHDEWEDILLTNHYHHVYSYGVNRYYVADEHPELDKRFIPMLEIMGKYRVYSMQPIYMCQ